MSRAVAEPLLRRRPVGSGDRRGPGGSLGVRIRRRMGRLLFQSHAWLGFAACMPVHFAETQFFLKETNKQASKQGCMGRGREQLSSRRSRLENVSQHLCPVPPEVLIAAVDSADVEVISLSPRSQYVVAFASRGRRLRPAYCSH